MDSRFGDIYMSLDGKDVDALPPGNASILERGSNSQYLESLAELALNPSWTGIIFASYEPLFVDICNRWISNTDYPPQPLDVAAALARILPFAAHLSEYAEEVIFRRPGGVHDVFFSQSFMDLSEISEVNLMSFLLCLTRLLEFDNKTFASAISPVKLQLLLRHSHHAVRYLAVKLLCLYLHVQDASFTEMISRHIGHDEISGLWDDHVIDYCFYPLWEGKRLNELRGRIVDHRTRNRDQQGELPVCRAILHDDLSASTIHLAGLLFASVAQQTKFSSSLVPTNCTNHNIYQVAKALLKSRAVLVTGSLGSGKTSVIRDIARSLRKESAALTLHLNEQTDAKLLIGLYTSSGTPGSFSWRPGILTTAVKEGRWVIIEDLDRAPAEVISVLLPLLERGELLVPNLGGTLRASSGFKLIATIRSTANIKHEEILPGTTLFGMRHWKHVSLQSFSDSDIQEIISTKYPVLKAYQTMIMNIYRKLQDQNLIRHGTSRSSQQSGNPITLQSLLRCCRRLQSLLVAAGIESGYENITEEVYDNLFLEVIDSFGASLQSKEARNNVATFVAQEMHIPTERAQYVTEARITNYVDSETRLQIGRATLSKRKESDTARPSKRRTNRRPFAITQHTARICESLCIAIKMREPCLLVGETGTGKTTVVQELADSLGHNLTVVNLSQQSEAGDLLGGFKPINLRTLAMPIKEIFDELFQKMFTSPKNQHYLKSLAHAVTRGEWNRTLTLWKEALKMVETVWNPSGPKSVGQDGSQPKKRRKIDTPNLQRLKVQWENFAARVRIFEKQVVDGTKGFAFRFVEGNLVKAVRNGDWVLLDEINLASPDTLESLADLLSAESNDKPFLMLSETGDIQRIEAHPGFRMFGAMNPATDIGKKDLPISLRSRFTEYYVQSPDNDLESLVQVIKAYLGTYSHTDIRAAQDIAKLYLEIRRLEESNQLVDGAGQKARFSLRTLTRTTTYIVDIAPIYGLRRAMFEGFAMSFLTLLNKDSELLVLPLIEKYGLGDLTNRRAIMNQLPRIPTDEQKYVRFKHYWMAQGPCPVQQQPSYIITPFIEKNLLNLVRATSTRRFPVLLQGPTSSGKTSMIEYLAKLSGNHFVRVNNHEHTDLQEYLGTYVSGPNGQLYYQEGVLVRALKEGHWIVLDELNLAPSDILEALNRLLDDNRELLIPETQEVVYPHANFMLFATQNPPGLYGGRKVLSRAFRNRFLELHFDDIPEDELETILRERSQIAPSFCTRIVAVYKRLAILRQSGRLFEQNHSFATLRDLFRWALRDADDREQLATNGFMLLAERVRDSKERAIVKETIEEVMKVKIYESSLYSAEMIPFSGRSLQTSSNIVWTKSMRRLYVLITKALKNKEPVLLVGETGCGKTTICQVIAETMRIQIHIVNAHQNTETGDIIGAQRPIRNRSAAEAQLTKILSNAISSYTALYVKSDLPALLEIYQSLPPSSLKSIPQEIRQNIDEGIVRTNALFEWSDGSLVYAMKHGHHFVLDEISLADDSVLERLNSVLEPDRTLLLAEKGSEDVVVIATEEFQFLATMNPGGDYGKKELSPALRNRFTEIWVPPLSEEDDVLEIVQATLAPSLCDFAKPIFEFSRWYAATYHDSSSSVSLREVLTWAKFMNLNQSDDPCFSLLHGAAMVYLDGLGANPAGKLSTSSQTVHKERQMCLEKLSELVGHDMASMYHEQSVTSICNGFLKTGHFQLKQGINATIGADYSLAAATTSDNAMRVVRALQLRKPILIEGAPGVGKTSLVVALANAIGTPLTRVNLSEQTDVMDLFGSDVPIDGGQVGQFAWYDAPFLQAMKRGEWVLLDEMNLASQSVLEGLNACLDHRGQVYIPEIDQTFLQHPTFAVFAAQNPHHHGGGRKGLPASFVNRFTVVYADLFTADDLLTICKQLHPEFVPDKVEYLINWVMKLNRTTLESEGLRDSGNPWEFNLRDILRWLQLLSSQELLMPAAAPTEYHNLLFFQRLRSLDTREKLMTSQELSVPLVGPPHSLYCNLSQLSYQVGRGLLPRQLSSFPKNQSISDANSSFDFQLLESIVLCVQHHWPCLLVGATGSGKTSLVRHLAGKLAVDLVEFPVNSEMDTMDLIGGYEQVDPERHIFQTMEQLKALLKDTGRQSLMNTTDVEDIMALVERSLSLDIQDRQRLHFFLQTLESVSILPGLRPILEKLKALTSTSSLEGNIRFEWVDGILVEALKKGQWLVLDNANLCNPSVLDRLNSLLEPDGVLAINEHRLSDGSVEVVRPHSSFQLFLMMDPRHGELSRSMRNRCTELFVPKRMEMSNVRVLKAFNEASLSRFRPFQCIAWDSFGGASFRALAEVCFDHLSLSDFQIIRRWRDQVRNGLLEIPSSKLPLFFSVFDIYAQMLEMKKNVIRKISGLHDDLASRSSFPQEFYHAQPIHPLNNPILLCLLSKAQNKEQPILLGRFFETTIQLEVLGQKIDNIKGSLKFRPERNLSKLEKSMASGRSLEYSRESTQPLADFIDSMRRNLLDWIDTHTLDNSANEETDTIFEEMTCYLRDVFDLAHMPSFNEAIFQVYLTLGRALSHHSQTVVSSCVLGNVLATNLEKFKSSWSLSTGTSMEILWQALKPKTTTSIPHLNRALRIETLASRFDDALWRSSAPLHQLITLRKSLAAGYAREETQDGRADNNLRDLETVLDEAEGLVDSSAVVKLPHFMNEFEGLRQYLSASLTDAADKMAELDVLAGRASSHSLRLGPGSAAYDLLMQVSRITGTDQPQCALMTVRNVFPIFMFITLKNTTNVSLNCLDMVCQELRFLASSTADVSQYISGNQYHALNSCLSRLLIIILESHAPFCQPQSLEVYLDYLKRYPRIGLHETTPELESTSSKPMTGSSPFENFWEVFRTHLRPATYNIHRATKEADHQQFYSGVAWIQTFLGCLKLYVPDRQFDPTLRPVVERERHERRKEELQDKLHALQYYEEMFHGQKQSLRSDLVDKAINALGRPPQIHVVVRPEISELGGLQGEFSNILRSVVNQCPDSQYLQSRLNEDEINIDELQLVRQNIAHATQRLTSSYRAYDDISKPIIGLLNGLDVGLALITMTSIKSVEECNVVRRLCKITPFIGLAPTGLTQDDFEDLGITSESDHRLALTYLKLGALMQGIQPRSEKVITSKMLEIFHKFFLEWKQQLQNDQTTNSTKASLYHYRGSHEDSDMTDEQEFRKLFPDFDENDKKDSMEHRDWERSPKELACILANHQDQFCNKIQNPSSLVLSMIEDTTDHIATLWGNSDRQRAFPILAEDTFPSAIIALHSCFNNMLRVPCVDRLYNFYTDANLAEAQKLVALLKRVKSRFKDIQSVWPEHATLEDVLRICDELLAFRNVESLAKIISKTEQLHSYVHEWQVVASRQYAATNLYDELTNMIIGWRRLELSTWARLLDMEDEACRTDARSWWFIAYEVIVSTPLSIISSDGNLRDHVSDLIATLEEFLQTTALGQYSHRLHLINQFKHHVKLLIEEMPLMQIVYAALVNFLGYYSKYVPRVQESIQKGRQALEKEMKEILLLASWKDTNINALRESSRRSHHKLFKVIRRYRALLTQVSGSMFIQGLPQDSVNPHMNNLPMELEPVSIDYGAIQECISSLPNWAAMPMRLSNPDVTRTNMIRLSSLPDNVLDYTFYVESFSSNLADTIKVLRQETPANLTNDNKDMVKHLKSRKRKVFSDTLKDMRIMGFKSNLGTDLLSRQATLSTIFATTPTLTHVNPEIEIDTRRAEDFFHVALNEIITARNSLRQQSGDLTTGDVSRGMGYLEGVLSVLLKQRMVLAASFTDLDYLDDWLGKMQGLWSPDSYVLLKTVPVDKPQFDSLEQRVRWLPSIMDTCSKIITMYDSLGAHDSSAVLEGLAGWRNRLANLIGDFENLPALPPGLRTSSHSKLRKDSEEFLRQFMVYIETIERERPQISFAIRKITPWLMLVESAQEIEIDNNYKIGLLTFTEQLSKTVDSTLVSLQDLIKIQSEMPLSDEEDAWLVCAEALLAKSLKVFRADQVTCKLKDTLSQLQHLHSMERELQTAAALCATVLPIIQQYRNIFRNVVSQYARLHGSLCRMSCILATSFKEILAHGFCSPLEKSAPEEGKEKIEGGTGLGEGEGADDISKDVQDDEDLSELAQDGTTEKNKEEIEDHDDAIDMKQDDLEGEIGDDAGETEDGLEDAESNKSDTEIDEGTGEVDDLDPSAVDEKLWEGQNNENEKDKLGAKSKGKKQEEMSAQDCNGEPPQPELQTEKEEASEEGAKESEEVAKAEIEKTDPHLQDGQNLNLTEEMDLDDEKSEVDSDSDGIDKLSDVDQEDAHQEGTQDDIIEETLDQQLDTPQLLEGGDDVEDDIERPEDIDDSVDNESSSEDQTDDADDRSLLEDSMNDTAQGVENAVSSELQGSGKDSDTPNETQDTHKSGLPDSKGSGSKSSGANEAPSDEKDGEPGDAIGSTDGPEMQDGKLENDAENQIFKKIGDALEKWHRQRDPILKPENDDQPDSTIRKDTDQSGQDFEHLPNDDATADTQILGAATEDQAHTLDKQALDSEMVDFPHNFLAEELVEQSEDMLDQAMEDMEPRVGDPQHHAEQSRPGAFMGSDARDLNIGDTNDIVSEDEEDNEDLDMELSRVHLESSQDDLLRSTDDARRLWSYYESRTRDLSLFLTEQLRLILAPTLATKMRGDFRTGKRLNIKRIIPFIASQYKRDKIWMRRSVPSKRNYQIMLAIDDSKSMGESGSGQLAFETLALVSKSLSMLEVGQICIVSFGDDVQVPHSFEQLFSSEAGANVFRHFGFQQTKTNVRKLIAESIDLFCRAKATSLNSAVDLWQLEIIISDGVCEDHESIRRLVRQAQEERIMIVFVIVDALQGESILDMTQATFAPDSNGETKLKIKRYLEDFPFGYYLIVGNVKELPGVLAAALRQWFAEVVESV